MGLQQRTIQKLFRETFSGTSPLVVGPENRKKLAAELKAKLGRIDGVETTDCGYVREEDKPRHVGSFSVKDPTSRYWSGDSFRLVSDDANRLTIEGSRGYDTALVSDLDEVVAFVRHCKQRLERKQALEAKQGKVRELLSQAILAQVRKLAREERFDFMSETDAQKLKLFVKLSDEHAVEVNILFKQFQEILPQLRSVIAALRLMYQSGIRFRVVGRRGLPWRKTWTTHESL